MEFRVLGPLEVVCQGVAVSVGGSRERAVLTRLLLSPNQVVSLESLADDLWAGEPPDGAAQALWVYMSRLRKALRDHGGDAMLVTRPPGYVLQVAATAVDANRFEALAARARREAVDADHPAAAETLREALALWRGAALADVADAPFARGEAARLEEARLAALEGRIDADLACGRHGELVGELAGLTRDHPLRERLWAQRMVTLYRAGRQAEALRAYQDLRRYLGEELGIEPAEDLRRLEGAILRHEPHLDRPGASGFTAASASTGLGETGLGGPGLAEPSPGVVAFLFTDLVGSTALLTRLGDDAADALLRRHFTLLRQALATHGGTEVKSLGDGLMAAFTSPAAAVRCGVAMQRAIAEGAAGGLTMRVGIHAGEPIGDDDDYFGTPVVVAQRLCDRARGGQILASALVQGLVGNRGDDCSFRLLGGLALKGLAEPVAVCEVVWERQPEVAVPLPLPLDREDSSAFVGRDDDMLRLETSWEAARSGRRRLVLLAGEPGIGKTRLAAETARLAHAAGATVLFGRCDEGMGVPYQPFVEALGGYLRQARAPVLGRLAGELVRLVPEIPESVGDLPEPVRSDPETERYRLFDAVAAWLSGLSGDTPVVLVVDDLHWATRPTLLLLSHLLRSGEPLRLLVLASYRDTELDLTAELADAVADLLRQPGVDRLRLPGLDEPAVAAFMEGRGRHELDDDARVLATTVHAETGGNPFFVGQVMRHLSETGALVRRDGRWTAGKPGSGLGLPEGARDVISRRLARLPDESAETLAVAAVIGDQFELEVLARAGGETEIATLRALDPALAARLVTEAAGPVTGHRFVHALVRATLYDALPAARRLELHRRAGDAIEAVHGGHLGRHLPALAHHFGRAGSGERSRALDYSARAGDRALAQLANDEAAGWFRRALELLDASGPGADDARRCDLLTSLGEAQRRAGDRAHRPTLLDAARLARDLGDAPRLARAALANSRFLFSRWGRVDHERTEVLEAALAALGPEDSTLRARLLATLAVELTFSPDLERPDRLMTEGLAMARRLGDPATLGYVLLESHVPAIGAADQSDLDERRSELAAVTGHLGDPALEFWNAFLHSLQALESGDLPSVDRLIEVLDRSTEEVGQPGFRNFGIEVTFLGRVIAGRFDQAEALAHEGLELAVAAGSLDAHSLFGGQLVQLRFEQGRLEEVLDLITRAAGRPGALPFTRATFGVALCELGRPADARPVFDDLVADGFRAVFRYDELATFTMLAHICAHLGDADRASELSGRLAPHAGRVNIWGTTTGPLSHSLGLLDATRGRHDQAEIHFADAARTAERIGAPGWLAHTRLEWARMLLRRAAPGDADQARELATRALSTAEELGMARVAAQARAIADG